MRVHHLTDECYEQIDKGLLVVEKERVAEGRSEFEELQTKVKELEQEIERVKRVSNTTLLPFLYATRDMTLVTKQATEDVVGRDLSGDEITTETVDRFRARIEELENQMTN